MKPTIPDSSQQHNHPDESKEYSAPESKPLNFSRTFMVWPLIGFSLLLAFGALPRYFQQQSLNNHTKEQLAEALPVSVVVAQPSPAVDEFVLPGTTQAIQDALIYARVDGYLHQRYVDIGDKVRAGQILADIDTPELDQQVQAAASNVEQATANLDNMRQAFKKAMSDEKTAAANVHKAKTDLQYYTAEVGRYKLLSQQGAVSIEDYDTRTQAFNAGTANLDAVQEAQESAQSTIKASTAAVHVAQAALITAQAQLQQITATRSFKKVTALFDGIVTQRNVDAGALVTSGSNSTNTVLFEIARTDVLRIFVYVPEQYVSDIRLGEQALLDVQEYPGKDFVGTVSHIAGGIDPTSKTLQVEIHVPNADKKLLPGMYVQVRFRSPSPIRMPKVPATTAQIRANGCFMYTVDDKNLVHIHKVEIGRDLGGQFEIAQGINIGDRVIINPSDELREGELVDAVASPAPTKSDGK